MNGAVIDTSVAVAWYLPEVFSRAARTLQTQLLERRSILYVPSLHFWEFANVMRTYVRRGEIEPDVAAEIWALHLEAPLETVEPAREQVLSVALEYGATVYDAVFIALALDLDVSLVTAERPTTPWVEKLGSRVELIAR